MDIKRQLAVVLMGTGVGLSGCQSAPLRGLAFWNKNDSASLASATPDVSKQRFDQLAAGQGRAAGQARPGTAALGGQKPADNDNFFTASWKKTTAAVTGTLAPKPKGDEAQDDPLRLDNPVKKVGPEVYVGAARLLENQSRFPEAQAQYQKALQVSPRDVGALVGLARLHDRQGNSRQAVELYQQAIAASPDNSLIYNDLGLCFARQHQHEASLQALSKAVELQPGSVKYRNNLAAVLVDLGRSDEALKHLTSGNSPAVAHYNLGYLLQQKGERAEALQHYQQALAFDPALAQARDMMAQLSGQQAEPRSAQPAWQAAAPQFSAQAPAAPAPQQTNRPAYAPAVPPAYGGSNSYSPPAPPVLNAPTQFTTSAPAASQSNFHIGDDEPAAEAASRRWKWESEWPSAGDQSGAGTVQPLPSLQ